MKKLCSLVLILSFLLTGYFTLTDPSDLSGDELVVALTLIPEAFEDMEEFSALYDRYTWDDFDNTYCDLTPMPELLEKFVKSHPNSF